MSLNADTVPEERCNVGGESSVSQAGLYGMAQPGFWRMEQSREKPVNEEATDIIRSEISKSLR